MAQIEKKTEFQPSSNHRFQASHLPVADPAISCASETPFLPIDCHLSVICGDVGYVIIDVCIMAIVVANKPSPFY